MSYLIKVSKKSQPVSIYYRMEISLIQRDSIVNKVLETLSENVI